MSSYLKTWISIIFLTLAASVWLTSAANAQNIVVDAAPSHVVNAFSPFRSLGAGVDRLGTRSTDHLLTDPILKEVLSAGWQAVTYRQNTELHVRGLALESQRHVEQRGKERGIFYRQRRAHRSNDSPFVGLPAPPSRF